MPSGRCIAGKSASAQSYQDCMLCDTDKSHEAWAADISSSIHSILECTNENLFLRRVIRVSVEEVGFGNHSLFNIGLVVRDAFNYTY